MRLSEFSIRRPVFAWILMAALILFGYLSFRGMGINENPDVEFPTLSVRYSYDGATPEVLEKDILEPVESVLVAMEGIRLLTSSAQRGSARIRLEFGLDKDIDFALQEVNTLVARAQRFLPDSVDLPVVTKSSTSDRPIMYLALSSKSLSQRELMILFRDQVRDRITTVEGVSEVRAFGFHEPLLRVDLDAEKLRRYELTAQDVVSSIQSEQQELPAGRFEDNGHESQVRIMGELHQADEFRRLIIKKRGGRPNFRTIRLGDVAKVRDGLENIRRISRVNGVRALGMAIQKRRGVNAAATAELVKERLREINTKLPDKTTLSINFDTTQFIRESVDELVFTLLLSALLTSLVCWLFIGSWSAATNILLAIPTAVLGTFIFVRPLGFTLNTFSLLGLTLAIGVIVDDAIIMLENITRYMQKGLDRLQAAYKGSKEISFAVIATTVSLVAIFVPIAWMPGIEGRFFFEFAVTICIAVSLSSLEALTLAPMRCSQFLRVGERTGFLGGAFEKLISWTKDRYLWILNWTLKSRVKTLLLASVAFFGSLFGAKKLGFELVPAVDRSVLFLVFQTPSGTTLDKTLNKIKDFEQITMNEQGVRRIFTAVGGFGRGGQANRGNGVVILEHPSERTLSQGEIARELRKKAAKLEGIKVYIRDRFGGSIGGRRGSPVEFTILGPESERQRELFREIQTALEGDNDLVGLRSDDTETLHEVHLQPDREKARQYGVSIESIARAVQQNYGGIVADHFTRGGRRLGVFVQLKDEDRLSSKSLETVLIRNHHGRVLPLSKVLDLREQNGPQIIFRENRERGVRVDASLAKGAELGGVIGRIKEAASKIIPKNYRIEFSETPQDKLMGMLGIFFMGLIFAYMVLASQFNSFVDPLLIFLAIPFGLAGCFVSLLIGGETLNMYSMIGILLTMGIVKKNSILLVEFTNQLRDQGKGLREAIKQAAEIRLRPILMTNLATIAASIPPALALGPGSETRVPMAISIIGGVAVAMFFTLFVVPVVYSIVEPRRIKVLAPSRDE